MKDFWNGYSREELERAADFYLKSPDGQWDLVAYDAILFVIRQVESETQSE